MKILVTGANGFVGRAVVAGLSAGGQAVRGAVRRNDTGAAPSVACVPVGDVNGRTDWSDALEGVTHVVHLVARTHKMRDIDGDDAYRAVNVDGTRRLAESAARAGVQRLVFVSSVKVNGEGTHGDAFTPWDTPAPEDAYGRTKWQAEQALAQVGARTGLEIVVLRPPLIYGPGVKANFARLIHWVRRGVPLPLSAVDNRRSLVALPNLVDLITRCLHVPEAAGEIFMVSDGQDVATPGLIRTIAAAMRCRARLFAVSPGLLTAGGRLLGREAEVARLIGSLQVDISHTRKKLDWQPPVSLEQGVRQAVAPLA